MLRRVGLAIMLISLTGCASSLGVLATPRARIEVLDLELAERAVLRETLEAMEGLEARAIVIPEEDYRKESTFAATFGFPFSGQALLAWWSKRITRVARSDAWTVAVYAGGHELAVRHDFFELALLDRLAVLVHEGRHADGDGFRHADCPAGFGLSGKAACDAHPLGAYAHQAAFLFELYARGLIDGDRARRGWLDARQRILMR